MWGRTDRQTKSYLHIRELSLTLGRPSPQPVRARQSSKAAKPLRSTPRQYQSPRGGLFLSPGRASPPSGPGHRAEAQETVQGHGSRWLRVSIPPPSGKARLCDLRQVTPSFHFLCCKVGAGPPARQCCHEGRDDGTKPRHRGWHSGGLPEPHLRWLLCRGAANVWDLPHCAGPGSSSLPFLRSAPSGTTLRGSSPVGMDVRDNTGDSNS